MQQKAGEEPGNEAIQEFISISEYTINEHDVIGKACSYNYSHRIMGVRFVSMENTSTWSSCMIDVMSLYEICLIHKGVQYIIELKNYWFWVYST